MAESMICGLIGTGIGRSLTPPMHEREGAAQGLHYLYRTIDLDARQLTVDDLARLVNTAADLGFRGLNITHPCKQLVIALLDELSEDASRLGAVNTVLFDGAKKIGHNTDWSGFGRNFDIGLAGASTGSVVQIGAGGAGAAVAYAVAKRGAGHLTVIDADLARATELAKAMASLFPAVDFEAGTPSDLERSLAAADGVVHATPTGMAAHPGTAFDPGLLRPQMWVAEVVYRPAETELLTAAAALGCRTLSGTGMAVHQAADAFEIFTGLEADTERMIAHMQELIAFEDATTSAGALT
ncbi:shikimate dehydrogenase [Rhodococcus sp. G-MC3]|uniref:shikimate dehydrogenase n=1 Tax=Rhodococcus sp. G-MC3 TaxID=3046209 RepID=UPI0024B956CF|nr:shikimate dehydrogenase [Rhodococcus sp. G-MC3]MDJ0394484.1 shikimate dehydrogenase [Rhodococcus sp. G-MC3]